MVGAITPPRIPAPLDMEIAVNPADAVLGESAISGARRVRNPHPFNESVTKKGFASAIGGSSGLAGHAARRLRLWSPIGEKRLEFLKPGDDYRRHAHGAVEPGILETPVQVKMQVALHTRTHLDIINEADEFEPERYIRYFGKE